MAKKNIVNITITNPTENELQVVKLMFGDRITISTATVDTKKSAPAKPQVVSVDNGVAVAKNIVAKPTTRKEAIAQWKIDKYGSEERADAVQKMANVVAEEWADTARKTGKYVVKPTQYKKKLYDEALRRVEEQENATKKSTTAKKSTKTTKKQ